MNRKRYLQTGANWLLGGIGAAAALDGVYIGTTWYRYGTQRRALTSRIGSSTSSCRSV